MTATEKREYVPQIGKVEDYIAQVDEIIAGLKDLHKRAGRAIEVYITQRCKDYPDMSRASVKQYELLPVGTTMDYIEALERARDRILP